ncbi:CdaR family transcriptional regulator [Alkalicoccus chagannorensis]|uniref:CdaR family transcriptional regulator n=1 Tax=Alkalicoccus chagannorensis TaxID=427072 RepID=UPI00041F3813|nr:sugar diacid recognition domain-containing protein [Alkalicoccus chagannorensis]
MELTPSLAQRIVGEVQQVLQEEMIVVNTEAEIIAAVKRERIGDWHGGAALVLEEPKQLTITPAMVPELAHVKPGIIMPLMADGRCIGVVGLTGEPDNIRPFADIVRRMTELIIQEAALIEQQEYSRRGLTAFFYEWLYLSLSLEEIERRASLLQVPIHPPFTCILVQCSSEAEAEPIALQRQMESTLQRHLQLRCSVPWGMHQLLVLADSSQADVLERMEEPLLTASRAQAGAADVHAVQDFPAAFQQAVSALQTGKSGLIRYETLVLEQLLAEVSRESAADFIRKVTGGFRGDAALIDTLHTLLDHDFQLKTTAEALHIHINTLHYRMQKIKERSGFHPRSSEGAAMFYLARKMEEQQNPFR